MSLNFWRHRDPHCTCPKKFREIVKQSLGGGVRLFFLDNFPGLTAMESFYRGNQIMQAHTVPLGLSRLCPATFSSWSNFCGSSNFEQFLPF